MEDIDIIDGAGGQPNQVPQAVKTLGILSIIGSSFWILIMLIGGIYIMTMSSAMGGVLGQAFGSAVGLVAGVLLFFIGLNVLTLVAAAKMMKGKKGMFIMYAIANGLWSLLFLISLGNQANPTLPALTGLAGIGFIIGFGVQMKNMPN